MKRFLIELDDRVAQELERVAPARKRMRAEFIRLAIQRALDLALDRATESAYRARPLAGGSTTADLQGWDEDNRLAQPTPARKKPKKRAA